MHLFTGLVNVSLITDRLLFPNSWIAVYICNLLNNFSGLDNGASRNINQIRSEKLKENEKRTIIIQSIIKTSEDDINKFIKADGTKFPNLIKEYKDLSKTINPLRSKLDLPPSNDLKPICN